MTAPVCPTGHRPMSWNRALKSARYIGSKGKRVVIRSCAQCLAFHLAGADEANASSQGRGRETKGADDADD